MVKTTARSVEDIVVDISDEACLEFGFTHGDIATNPNDKEVTVTIIGVAPGNDGENVLWYEIHHPRTKGKVCYWGGPGKNLFDAGFRKVE